MRNESATSIHQTEPARKGGSRETAAGFAAAARAPSCANCSPAAVSGGLVEQLLLEDVARELAAKIRSIKTREAWIRWRRANASILAVVYRLLPDCPAKRSLTLEGRAAKTRFAKSARRVAEA